MNKRLQEGRVSSMCETALTILALAFAALASAPSLAAPDTKISASAQRRNALLKACPETSRHWAEVRQLAGFDGAIDDSANTASFAKAEVHQSRAGFDIGHGTTYGELFLHVSVPSCTSVAYGWHAEYAGGMHIPAAVHPSLMRDGERVAWAALNELQKQDLLHLMRATLRSPIDHSFAGDHSIAGILWRTQHASAAPRSVPTTTPPSPPSPPTLLDPRTVEYATGRPHEERRVFFECPMSSHTADEPADGLLFLGSRLVELNTLNGLSLSRVSLGPALEHRTVYPTCCGERSSRCAGQAPSCAPHWAKQHSSGARRSRARLASVSLASLRPGKLFGALVSPLVARVYGPQPWLAIHDSQADRTLFVPDNRGGLLGGGMIYAARATAITMISTNRERAVILGGTRGCDARLLDLKRLRLYVLPGKCAFKDSDTDYALLQGDGAGRVVWFKSDNDQGSRSGGVVIDYAELLHSEATGGVEIVSPEKTLVWGATHNNLDVMLTALLLAPGKTARDEALAALKAFAGWETPSFPWVGMRAAARAAAAKRPPIAEKGNIYGHFELQVARPFQVPRPYWLLGSLGEVSYLLVVRGETPKNTLELEIADGVAIVAVPKSAVFPSESLARLQQLLDATIRREFNFREASGHYTDYSTALLQVLVRRPLTSREEQRACAVEKELLVGHGGWEFDEIIDTWCEQSWNSATSDIEQEDQARLRPASKVCAEWKAMCPRAGGAPSSGGG